MDKNTGSTKSEKINQIEDKRKLPVFAKFGLIAAAIVAVIVVAILVVFNLSGSYVATVDGQKIKTGEYKYYLTVQMQSMLAAAQEADPNVTEETFWATKIGGEDAFEVAKKKALDSIKEAKIQYAKAKEAKVSLGTAEIKQIDDSIQSSIIDSMDPQNTSKTAGAGSKIRANKEFVKTYGFSIDEMRSAQIENYTVQKYQTQQITAIKDADAGIDANYAKRPDWYKEDTQLRKGAEEAVWARHILISVASDATDADKAAAKKKAEDLVAKLDGGADFVSLVKDNSEDPGSKDRGGDYVFGKSASFYTEFKDAAFGLNPGEYTRTPVLTGAGYHIIKLEEKYAKDAPVSLKCAKEYYEYGINFVKFKLYTERVAEWAKDPKYKLNTNTSAYNSITKESLTK